MGLSHTILNRAFARRKMLGGRLELPFSCESDLLKLVRPPAYAYAGGETRTLMGFPIRPWTVRVYQFHHSGAGIGGQVYQLAPHQVAGSTHLFKIPKLQARLSFPILT